MRSVRFLFNCSLGDTPIVSFLFTVRGRGQPILRKSCGPILYAFGKERHSKIRPPSRSTHPEQDVLLALSEEVHRIEAEKKGASIDLPQYFQAKVRAATEQL